MVPDNSKVFWSEQREGRMELPLSGLEEAAGGAELGVRLATELNMLGVRCQ